MADNSRFRVAATSARLITGTIVAAVSVAAVVFGTAMPWPTIVNQPAQTAVTPMPGDTLLACNGDLRAIGRDPANPLEMVAAASPRLTAEGRDGDPEQSAMVAGDLVGAGDVLRLTGKVQGRSAPLIGAAESFTVSQDDMFGFAAAPCRAATLESWLIGGSVATGTEDLIVLTNPGAVASNVTLTLYGGSRGSSTAIVPAGAQIALPLTSIAPGADAPVIRVSATGSPVRAVLQSSLTRILDPAGIDLQDAVAVPSRHVVIPGLQLFESDSDSSEMGILRLLALENDTEAAVTVREVGESAPAAEFSFPLTADEPAQVSLSTLAPGYYTVEIDADTPVLAAVRAQDGSGPQSDFAWLPAAAEITGDTVFAVPSGPAARLSIANDGAEDAAVRIEEVGGGTLVEVTVSADSEITVDVDSSAVYTLSASEPIYAAVTMSAVGALAAWPISPAHGQEQSITVYP